MGEYLPGAHRVHASEPCTDLYSPGTHAVHLPPPPTGDSVYPALQWQSSMLALDSFELLCMGQGRHMILYAALYVFFSHFWHTHHEYTADQYAAQCRTCVPRIVTNHHHSTLVSKAVTRVETLPDDGGRRPPSSVPDRIPRAVGPRGRYPPRF